DIPAHFQYIATHRTRIRGRKASCGLAAEPHRQCVYFRSLNGKRYKIPLRTDDHLRELVRESGQDLVGADWRWVAARKELHLHHKKAAASAAAAPVGSN
ncbi:unnamed protein product, partial [Amoebophrya sp. A120]